MEQPFTFDPKGFLQWFEGSGGWVDRDLLDLVPFPGMGYGAIALNDIPADKALFHIPDELILSPETSQLRQHLSPSEWDSLDHGWCRLIICMIWETVRGSDSPWSGYLGNMPVEFDTPMFWTDAEKEELVGTDLQDRIGKSEAEAQWFEHVKPIIDAHPDLFPPTSNQISLPSFHLHGSRILSRSFTISASHLSGNPAKDDKVEDSSDSDSDDDDDDPSVVVMIPLADMLNAAYMRDNANLYAEEQTEAAQSTPRGGFTMKSTQNIKKACQIYNTYASPPNSELLRKYGHVDILPLPAHQLESLDSSQIGDWPYGNPGDEVMVDGSQVLKAVASQQGFITDLDAWTDSIQPRVDWWVEEGEEDIFVVTLEPTIDDGLVAFTRLLLYDHEWARAKKKGKLPHATIDDAVARVLQAVLLERKNRYQNSITDNLALINEIASRVPHIIPPNQLVADLNVSQIIPSIASDMRVINAAIVKLGELRILGAASRRIASQAQLIEKKKKRKAESD